MNLWNDLRCIPRLELKQNVTIAFDVKTIFFPIDFMIKGKLLSYKLWKIK